MAKQILGKTILNQGADDDAMLHTGAIRQQAVRIDRLEALVQALAATLGTALWFDIGLNSVTGGTAAITGITIGAVEL